MSTVKQNMLTAKEKETYDFIKAYVAKHNISPTGREIAEGIGIKSRGVVHRYVSKIAEEGLVALEPNRRRNIRLLNAIAELGELPVLGKIAAGMPIEAIQEERVINVSDTFLGANRFVLEVKGDSMIGDNICEGDYIVCEKRTAFAEQDIVVALIDGVEATLKRIKNNKNGSVSLIPSNPSLEPMVYDAEQVQVQGVYLGLLRLM